MPRVCRRRPSRVGHEHRPAVGKPDSTGSLADDGAGNPRLVRAFPISPARFNQKAALSIGKLDRRRPAAQSPAQPNLPEEPDHGQS
jgi:hypothetical protein